jgi:hypothetical protein
VVGDRAADHSPTDDDDLGAVGELSHPNPSPRCSRRVDLHHRCSRRVDLHHRCSRRVDLHHRCSRRVDLHHRWSRRSPCDRHETPPTSGVVS